MRLIITLLALLSAFISNGQIDLKNQTAVRQDSSFLFYKEDNEVIITGSDNAGWQLKAAHSDVGPNGIPNHYNVIPNKSGPDTLRLFKNGKLVLTKVFYSIPATDPVCYWGALRGNKASVAEIIANKKIVCFQPGITGRWSVFHWKLILETNEVPEALKMQDGGNNILTADMIEAIRKLSPGDKITFKDITVACPSCRVRIWGDVSFIIK